MWYTSQVVYDIKVKKMKTFSGHYCVYFSVMKKIPVSYKVNVKHDLAVRQIVPQMKRLRRRKI